MTTLVLWLAVLVHSALCIRLADRVRALKRTNRMLDESLTWELECNRRLVAKLWRVPQFETFATAEQQRITHVAEMDDADRMKQG